MSFNRGLDDAANGEYCRSDDPEYRAGYYSVGNIENDERYPQQQMPEPEDPRIAEYQAAMEAEYREYLLAERQKEIFESIEDAEILNDRI